MKKTIKQCMGRLALVSLLALAVGAVPVGAVNLDDLNTAELDKIDYVVKVSSNISKAINLFYVGSATEALVTITQSSIAFYAPFNTPDTGIGGTSYGATGGVFDISVSTMNTMGVFCDTINNSTNYRCNLLGATRADNPSLLRDQAAASGTNNLGAVGGFDVLFDTGGLNTGSISTNFNQMSIGITPKPLKRVRVRQCEWNVQGTANRFQILGQLRRFEGASDRVRNDTTIAYEETFLVNQSTRTVNYTVNGFGPMEFSRNTGTGITNKTAQMASHVVIRASDDTVQSQPSGNSYLTCWIEER